MVMSSAIISSASMSSAMAMHEAPHQAGVPSPHVCKLAGSTSATFGRAGSASRQQQGRRKTTAGTAHRERFCQGRQTHRRVLAQHAHVSKVQNGLRGYLQQSTIAARMLPRDNVACPARIGLPILCCTNTKAASHVQVLNHTKARHGKRQPAASTNLCGRGVGGNMHAGTICKTCAFQCRNQGRSVHFASVEEMLCKQK